MSLQQYVTTVNCSTPGIVVTGSGLTARGGLVIVAVDAGAAKVFDSNVSTNSTSARIVGVATATCPFEPLSPVFYRQGLYVNASAATTVVVGFVPRGAG